MAASLASQAGSQEEEEGDEAEDRGLSSRLRYALICASNMNRSMEAHSLLQSAGFAVRSQPPFLFFSLSLSLFPPLTLLLRRPLCRCNPTALVPA